jgi:hypothetical protein
MIGLAKKFAEPEVRILPPKTPFTPKPKMF